VTLAGCTGFAGGNGAGTATAQAERAVRLATQIGQSLQETREAGNQQAKATASARQALLQDSRQWPVLISDTFDDNHLEWTTGEQEDPELAAMSWSIADGKYRWQARASNGFIWWVTPESEAFTDFYLTVSILQDSQSGVGEYGLVFRQISDEDYYLFEVNGSNEYALFLHWADGWEPLIDWTPHPAIATGSLNRLEVIAHGAEFTFMINNVNVAGYSDERFPQGAVGLAAGLANKDETATWEFDDFMLRAP
jgi:hypothetical protein